MATRMNYETKTISGGDEKVLLDDLTPERPTSQRRRTIVIVVIVAVLAIAIAAYAFSRKTTAPAAPASCG